MTPTQKKIHKLIKKGKIMTVSDMCRKLGMSRASFYENLIVMKKMGVVKEQPSLVVVE